MRVLPILLAAVVFATTLSAGAPSAASAVERRAGQQANLDAGTVWLEWNLDHKRTAGKLTSGLLTTFSNTGRVVVQRYITPSLNATVADTGRVHPAFLPLSTAGVSYVPGDYYRACAWLWYSRIDGPGCTRWLLLT